MADANTWFTPGRPDHPDFLILADLVLSADAASDEGNLTEYVNQYSTVPLADLSDIAFHEANALLDSHPLVAMTSLMEAAWTMGFAAGVRVSRGESPPTQADLDNDPAAAAYAGADPRTVRYVARQRGMRVTTKPAKQRGQRVVLLAGTWLDGLFVGLRYDERRAATNP